MGDDQATNTDPTPEPVPDDAPAVQVGVAGVGPTSPGPLEDQAAALAEATASPHLRGAMSLISLGILLFLVALAGWWAQDAIGTLANEAETDIGAELTFTSDGGSYRLVSSGPLRPAAETTYCDITTSDGKTDREVGGQGLQAGRLGVDRLMTIHPPAGATTVRCSNRGSDVVGNGRYQVLDSSSPLTWIPAGLFTLAMASIAAGVLWGFVGYRRSTRSPAN